MPTRDDRSSYRLAGPASASPSWGDGRPGVPAQEGMSYMDAESNPNYQDLKIKCPCGAIFTVERKNSKIVRARESMEQTKQDEEEYAVCPKCKSVIEITQSPE
jgi:Zn finger protein HypA/HybF involved in hydrogenase expression